MWIEVASIAAYKKRRRHVSYIFYDQTFAVLFN